MDNVFEETFVSPFPKDTKAAAERVLETIRSCHQANWGWKEIAGYVEELPNGKFRAVRKHVQYK